MAIAATILAVKINEDKLLSFEQGAMECGGVYTPAMIEKTEMTMLQLIQFQTNFPTAMDFLQYLLYLSNQSYNFNEVIHECLSFVYVSLIGNFDICPGHVFIDYNLCRFRPSSVAVASILLALEFRNMNSFKQEWY